MPINIPTYSPEQLRRHVNGTRATIPPSHSPAWLRALSPPPQVPFTGSLAFLNREAPCEVIIPVKDYLTGQNCKVIVSVIDCRPTRYRTFNEATSAYLGRVPFNINDHLARTKKENKPLKPVPTLSQLDPRSSSSSSSRPSSPPLAESSKTGATPVDTSAASTSATEEERPALTRSKSFACVNELPSRMNDFDLFHFAKAADSIKEKPEEEDEDEDEGDDDEEDSDSDSDSDDEEGHSAMALFRPVKSKPRAPLGDRQTQDAPEPSTPITKVDKGKGKAKAGIDQGNKDKENEHEKQGNDTPLPSPSLAPKHLDWFSRMETYELFIRTKGEGKYDPSKAIRSGYT